MDPNSKPNFKSISDAIDRGIEEKRQMREERLKQEYARKNIESERQRERDERNRQEYEKQCRHQNLVKNTRPSKVIFDSYVEQLEKTEPGTELFDDVCGGLKDNPDIVNLYYYDVNAGSCGRSRHLKWPKFQHEFRYEDYVSDCPYGGYSHIFKNPHLNGYRLVGYNSWRFFILPYRTFTIDIRKIGPIRRFFSLFTGRL